MNIINLKNTIFATLKADNRIWNSQKTELNQTLLIDLLDKIDEKLIAILLENEDIKDKFFLKIKTQNKETLVFKNRDFQFFLEENKIYNSYTKYKNQIGLSDGKKFLKDTNDVVLNFPFKDCVLEGGQSTEEGEDNYFQYEEEKQKIINGEKITKLAGYQQKTSKRKEIFFNQILAADEIDRLFDEKALVGWKRFNQTGESEVKEIKRDANGTIKENLIIKGNNLLALHSLKSQFSGKIKLIYIDPPYNTGNDGFKYNDNFNHSSWLTFMKNRLEVARELLRDDGVIFVQCDDNEQAYLKVLMDEVFGRENFVNVIIMKTINPNGIKTTNAIKTIIKVKEQILVFKKNQTKFNPQFKTTEEYDKYYNLFIEGDLTDLKHCLVIKLEDKLKEQNLKIDLKNGNFKKFVIENSDRIFQTKFDKRVQNNIKYSDGKLHIFEENPNYWVYQKRFGLKLSKTVREIFGKKELSVLLGDVWDDFKLNNLYLEGDVDFSSAKKPEHLISRIINLATNENDIVLDFFLGSGTTAAVAHKMNRQYIGIEQMDYIETIAVERLKKVIEGEQGGISKSVNWQGGGDFIYFELAKHNETAKEKINNCVAKQELLGLFEELYDKYFLNYNLKIKEFKEKVSREGEFQALDLEEQKRMFLTMLDLNQMYVNKSEMADKNFAISQQDQELTKEFYKSEV